MTSRQKKEFWEVERKRLGLRSNKAVLSAYCEILNRKISYNAFYHWLNSDDPPLTNMFEFFCATSPAIEIFHKKFIAAETLNAGAVKVNDD